MTTNSNGARTDCDVDWTFEGTWPFEPKWFDTPDGQMHYVDEGPADGRPVVLVHGNPTWGYLYRRFIPPLVDAGYRVIVPDHLGFGRSEKPNEPEHYRIPRHAERMEALLESLDLHDATVVPQDWGGPIGLAWAVRHPERIGGLFILNTFAHKPVEAYQPPLALTLFRTPGIGEVLVKGLNIFVRGFLFREGVAKRERITSTVQRAYLAPFPTWSSRTSVLVFPRKIPVTPDAPLAPFLAEVEEGMQKLKDRPVQVAWGMKDPVFTPDFIDVFWKRTFPDAEVMRLAEASHYLQEDAHEEIVPAPLRFLV
jgi:cis-3-alkyl-4-acyloxetan-2-one decarboxylase